RRAHRRRPARVRPRPAGDRRPPNCSRHLKEEEHMPLDPECRMLMDQMQGTMRPFNEMSVAEARDAIGALAAAAGAPEEVAHVEDRPLPGPAGESPVRVYRPQGAGPLPVLVYFHGGGWVIGSLETHDPLCRHLANAIGSVVVSVDYRLAPEHPYPAAIEDAHAATAWIAQNAALFDGDRRRIAV